MGHIILLLELQLQLLLMMLLDEVLVCGEEFKVLLLEGCIDLWIEGVRQRFRGIRTHDRRWCFGNMERGHTRATVVAMFVPDCLTRGIVVLILDVAIGTQHDTRIRRGHAIIIAICYSVDIWVCVSTGLALSASSRRRGTFAGV